MNAKLLTELELEVMLVLWALGSASAGETREALTHDYAPTTVSTVLRILEDKDFVSTHKDGRRHVYTPRISKQTYEKHSVKHLVRRVFGGDKSQLVRALFDNVSEAELKRVEKLLGGRSS